MFPTIIIGASVSGSTDEDYNIVSSEIFSNYSGLQSEIVQQKPNDALLSKKVIAKNGLGDEIGYVYQAVYSYDNPAGGVDQYTAIIGIDKDKKLAGIKYTSVKHNSLEQADVIVEEYVKENYKSGLTLDNVNSINDANTDGSGIARIVKKMVLAAIGDSKSSAPLKEDRDADIIKDIYSKFDVEKSEITKEGFTNAAVLMKVVAKDSAGSVLGTIYKVTETNKHGVITLMVAIDNDGKLYSVEFVKNGQTAGPISSGIKDHTDEKYTAGLDVSKIDEIELLSGSSVGTGTVKNLVKAAFAEHNGGAQ